MCPKVVFTEWNRHLCKSRNVKNCFDCKRILMKNGIPYCIYKKTENMFCNALQGKYFKECQDCKGSFRTQDCYLQHKKNKKCNLQYKCQKCNRFITYYKKELKEKAIDDHDCNINIKYCEDCRKRHNKNEECKLSVRNIRDWENFPKLCLIAASVSDCNSFIDCIECSKQKIHCKYHKENNQKDSFVNFLYILREVEFHGNFQGVYVTEEKVENEIEHIIRSYEPKVNVSTNSEPRKTNFGQPVKNRNKEQLKLFNSKNGMDRFLKEIMENESYQNSVGIIESPIIMDFIIKSLGEMKVKIDLAPGKTRLDLNFINFSFICIDNYLKDFTSFVTTEKKTRYFPLGLNLKEFYNYDTLPDLSYFQFLSDSRKEIEKKELFWKSCQHMDWKFLDQMKKYLFNRVEKLLEATVKLTKLAFEIQNMLRKHYVDAEKYPIGSIFRAYNMTAFFYTLLLHYRLGHIFWAAHSFL